MNLLKNQCPIWLGSYELQRDQLYFRNLQSSKRLYLFKYALGNYKNTFIRRFLLFNSYLNNYLIRTNRFWNYSKKKYFYLSKRILKRRYVKKYWLHLVRLFTLKRRIIRKKRKLVESLLLNARQRKFRFLVSSISDRMNKKVKDNQLRIRRRRILFLGIRKRRHWYPKPQYRKLKRLKRRLRRARNLRVRLKHKTIRQGKKFRFIPFSRHMSKQRLKHLKKLRLKKKAEYRLLFKRFISRKINPAYIKLRNPGLRRIRFLRKPRFSFVWTYYIVLRRLNRFYKWKRRIKRSKKFAVKVCDRIRIVNKRLAQVLYRANWAFLNRISSIADSQINTLAILRRKFLLSTLKPILKGVKPRFAKKKNPKSKSVIIVRRLYRSMFSLIFKNQPNKFLFKSIVYYLSYKFLKNQLYNLKFNFDKRRWLMFISKFKYRKLFRLILKFKTFYLFKKLRFNYFFLYKHGNQNFREIGLKKTICSIFSDSKITNTLKLVNSSFYLPLGKQIGSFEILKSIYSIRALRKFYGKFRYYGLTRYWNKKLRRRRLKRISNTNFIAYRRRNTFTCRRRPMAKLHLPKKSIVNKLLKKKWWPKNWKSTPRQKQNMIKKRRALFNISRIQLIRKSLRSHLINYNNYIGRFYYWELRILRRHWRAFLISHRRQRRRIRMLLLKKPFVRVVKFSKIFCLDLKHYLRQRKKYFLNHLTRRLIHQRDKAYFSKWAYVKFRKTRHNLFISIYDKWNKLLFHTSAWAFASRRDPDRFSYKSLVFAARKLAARLWKLRFKRITVRLNSPISFQIRIFLKTLKFKKIKILSMLNFIKIPHNGLRPQKSRTQK